MNRLKGPSCSACLLHPPCFTLPATYPLLPNARYTLPPAPHPATDPNFIYTTFLGDRFAEADMVQALLTQVGGGGGGRCLVGWVNQFMVGFLHGRGFLVGLLLSGKVLA